MGNRVLASFVASVGMQLERAATNLGNARHDLERARNALVMAVSNAEVAEIAPEDVEALREAKRLFSESPAAEHVHELEGMVAQLVERARARG